MTGLIADAYYEADDPAKAGVDQKNRVPSAKALRNHFRMRASDSVWLLPAKMQMFCILPLPIMRMVQKYTAQGRFGAVFVYRHAMKNRRNAAVA